MALKIKHVPPFNLVDHLSVYESRAKKKDGNESSFDPIAGQLGISMRGCSLWYQGKAQGTGFQRLQGLC